MEPEDDFDAAFGEPSAQAGDTPETVEATADPVEPVEPVEAADEPVEAVEAAEPVEVQADTVEPEQVEQPAAVAAPAAPVIDPVALAEAMADAQERRQRAATPAPVVDAPRAATMDDFLDDKAKASIALFKSEWAEVEAPVNALINAALQAQAVNMQREFQQVMQQRLAPVESVAAQSQEAMYWQTVQAAHPDFQEAAAALPAWIQKQPAILRPTLERVYNGGTAVEVVELLSAYKQAIGSTGAAPVTPASSAAQVTPRVAAVDKAVLAATLAPPAAQRSTKQTSRDPNDVEGSFMEAFG
jgi:hypothetical protein